MVARPAAIQLPDSLLIIVPPRHEELLIAVHRGKTFLCKRRLFTLFRLGVKQHASHNGG